MKTVMPAIFPERKRTAPYSSESALAPFVSQIHPYSVLSISHQSSPGPGYSVALRLSGIPGVAEPVVVPFDFHLSEPEREDIRWYLEIYPDHPYEERLQRAQRIEKMIADIGTRLFASVFRGSAAENLWKAIEPHLPETRVEVTSLTEAGWVVPWELIRTAQTNSFIALRAREFVRTYPDPARQPPSSIHSAPPFRILVVAARPFGHRDTPSRSIIGQLVAALGYLSDFQIDVVRPPTYEKLEECLRRAKRNGQPYHVVHFDGHGVFLDLQQVFSNPSAADRLLTKIFGLNPVSRYGLVSVFPYQPAAGSRGYLMFENHHYPHNVRFVDGQHLAELLTATMEIPTLVLNACRTAALAVPQISGAFVGEFEVTEMDSASDVRTFGSFAHEVMHAGAAGVVAMQYSVYVVAAAQFVNRFYQELVQGRTFGVAASAGRQALDAGPYRSISFFNPVPLQDWMVPVVYEPQPFEVFPAAFHRRRPVRRSINQVGLPEAPGHGVYGEDATLLDLDRAFYQKDRTRIVLLQGLAGSGKTTLAAQFALDYALTGGSNGFAEGVVLWTSFEHFQTLAQVLDSTIGRAFADELARQGKHWGSATPEQQREWALDLLATREVIWVWDNIETIAGFPGDHDTQVSPERREELGKFLFAVNSIDSIQAKILLTSRPLDHRWLNGLPVSVNIYPIPDRDRMRMALRLAAGKIEEPNNWLSLLKYTEGNPLTLRVVIGQALRLGHQTSEELKRFEVALRAGEEVLDDDPAEGRPRSLSASLDYGFLHSFTDLERRRLALLHFFQGFVHIDVFCALGDPDLEWCVPAVRSLSRRTARTLLNKAVGLGLLMPADKRSGKMAYVIHPALPWYFRKLFRQFYSDLPDALNSPLKRATRAFAEVMSDRSDRLYAQYEIGDPDAIPLLEAEEPNILQAKSIAQEHKWNSALVGALIGLETLYEHTGRRAEWKRTTKESSLLAEQGPSPGQEYPWLLINDFQARILHHERRWSEAEQVIQKSINWLRQEVRAGFRTLTDVMNDPIAYCIHGLSISLQLKGILRMEQDAALDAIPPLVEAVQLLQDFSGNEIDLVIAEEAIVDIHLGDAYASVHQLEQAEYWYRRSFRLRMADNILGRAQCLSSFGNLELLRFRYFWSRENTKSAGRHLRNSIRFYERAVSMMPGTAVEDLADVHQGLGDALQEAGRYAAAIKNYEEAIYYGQGNGYVTGTARLQAAKALLAMKRNQDSLGYAEAAARDLEELGNKASQEFLAARCLINRITKP